MTAKKILSLMQHFGWSFWPILFRALRFEGAKHAPWSNLIRARVFNFEMLVPTKVDGIGRALFVFQGREFDHKWMLEQVLRTGNCIFDLGANIGYYALLEASILEHHCRIFAIEPDPRNIEVLKRNVAFRRLESVVSIDHGAISNQDGEAEMVLDRRSNLSRLSGVGASQGDGERVPVRIFDFKGYVERLPVRIDLVRMDIEGGEVEVFEALAAMAQGGAAARRPRRIIFETHDYGARRDRMTAAFGRVLAGGYRVEYLSSDDHHTDNPVIGTYGYKPDHVIEEWGVTRGVYRDIRTEDAVKLIPGWRGTRTVCLVLDK